ncbi:hypothetical protein Taro_032261 [Colocasia esculenta]|uniref:Uncharacterized protein n=1 Tax=Colocasia esculenta TaxID=4460 RepID=A0A843VWW1_COLES|nr:hypothetical protein [Colocasia esculenta]
MKFPKNNCPFARCSASFWTPSSHKSAAASKASVGAESEPWRCGFSLSLSSSSPHFPISSSCPASTHCGPATLLLILLPSPVPRRRPHCFRPFFLPCASPVLLLPEERVGWSLLPLASVMKQATGTFHVLSKHARSWALSSAVIMQRMFSATPTGHCRSSEDLSACENAPEFGRCPHGGGYFHKSAAVDPTSRIDIGAVVHSKAVLGANVHVGSGTVVGPSVSIGESTKIGYKAALTNCSVGMSCIIHSGVCIGQDGFGFFVDEEGCVKKKPQMLYVRIGNDVEIGANTCIDRGSWRDTSIGDHTKIDNLVQKTEEDLKKICISVACFCRIGDYVTMGGRVAVRDHISIVSKVRLAGNTCVTKDITSPGDFAGFPALLPAGSGTRMAQATRKVTEIL